MTARKVSVRLTGSPSVAAIAAAESALVNLIGSDAIVLLSARCVCDGCGAKSEPVDTSDPAAAEVALRYAGWSRDPIARTDACPACAEPAVPMDPDCRSGNKHRACSGRAWDDDLDCLTDCACGCHQEVGV